MNNATVKMFIHRSPSPKAVFYGGRNREIESARLDWSANSLS
jgi:hypothetical protein